MSAIPIIDVALLFDDQASLADRQQVGREIVAAAETIGFLMVKNTSLPTVTIQAVFSVIEAFFAQPIEEKRKIDIQNSTCHRGYFGYGRENLDPQQQRQGDHKEGMKIGQDLPMDHPWVVAGLPLHGPNQWPNDPQFKETIWPFYQQLSGVADVLLSGIAMGLALPPDYFAQAFSTPMATLAPLHYPETQSVSSRGSLGAGAHTDFGCITLVMQDDTSGLQVKDKADQWIDVPVVEDALVMNIGDMLQRWSNDRLKSTWHRVINQAGKSRYSMAFFYEPEHDTMLTCLPTCESADRPFPYEPMTALDYLLKRISETFDYYDHQSEKTDPDAIG